MERVAFQRPTNRMRRGRVWLGCKTGSPLGIVAGGPRLRNAECRQNPKAEPGGMCAFAWQKEGLVKPVPIPASRRGWRLIPDMCPGSLQFYELSSNCKQRLFFGLKSGGCHSISGRQSKGSELPRTLIPPGALHPVQTGRIGSAGSGRPDWLRYSGFLNSGVFRSEISEGSFSRGLQPGLARFFWREEGRDGPNPVIQCHIRPILT